MCDDPAHAHSRPLTIDNQLDGSLRFPRRLNQRTCGLIEKRLPKGGVL